MGAIPDFTKIPFAPANATEYTIAALMATRRLTVVVISIPGLRQSEAAQALLGVGKRLPCMNTIILNEADAEQSETEHSPSHRCKRDLLLRNASRQASAPSSMVMMNG